MVEFTKMNLKKEIVSSLKNNKFNEMTDVQEKVIPLILQGKNVVFTSRTGSGKTLAYLLGYLSRINKKNQIQMIVLVPTRELCIQVGKDIKQITEELDINVGTLYGGRDIKGDVRTIKSRVNIMVGTPGRLIQHINMKNIKVGEVRYLVYDESDQMFDQGFYDECKYLKTRISKDAQIVLSSATITDKVKNFIEEEIANFELLEIGDLISKNLKQDKIFCGKLNKKDLLLKLFEQKKFKRAMIFANTKIRSAELAQFLTQKNFRVRYLNKNLTQEERQNALNLFKEGKISILVSTDVAARGLNIKDVDIVVNYDIPIRSEFYVHRIGRSGRKDKAGYALSLIIPEDEERFEQIEKEFDLKITEKDLDLKSINSNESSC